MSLDEIHDVDDYSEITVRAMIERLRRSYSPEHFIYRETELDEMWRVVDMALRRAAGDAAAVAHLSSVRAAIMRSHDLVGVDGQPAAAARALEAILPEIAPGR